MEDITPPFTQEEISLRDTWVELQLSHYVRANNISLRDLKKYGKRVIYKEDWREEIKYKDEIICELPPIKFTIEQ